MVAGIFVIFYSTYYSFANLQQHWIAKSKRYNLLEQGDSESKDAVSEEQALPGVGGSDDREQESGELGGEAVTAGVKDDRELAAATSNQRQSSYEQNGNLKDKSVFEYWIQRYCAWSWISHCKYSSLKACV